MRRRYRGRMSDPAGEFHGKVVVVTGGRSGIGCATVQAFLQRGATVASLDVTNAPAPHDPRRIERICDVRDAEETERCIADLCDALGGIDVVVQCAGITRDGVLWKLALKDWDDVLETNLTGAFHVMRAVAPRLRARGGGAVIHVSSINGERGKFGQANYAASKGGLIALTKTAARELGRFGVRVNAVAPGFVRTPMTEHLSDEVVEQALEESILGRASEPEDVANAIVFLASDQARQITGQTIRVDAGQYV